MNTKFTNEILTPVLRVLVQALIAVAPPILILLIDPALLYKYDNKILLLNYTGYVFIVFLIGGLITQRLHEKKYAKRHQYMQLYVNFIQKQLDTHFTFNILNSISASILRNDRSEAHKQLTVFAKVLRFVFDDKKSLLHQLDKELELTQNYLILEKYRFKEKFDYTINREGNINGLTMVPKQIIQIFVDNAIRHGLMPLVEGGYLTLNIANRDDKIHISVEDNGVGREEASRVNKLEKPGNSIKLLYQMVDYLNKFHSEEKIQLKIFDLYKNGKAAGTRMELNIPSGYDPKIA
ncbi:MAG: histidine kinase [Bacteroidales bacterium]|nr:histidine kinase [Bacteroidales bacterium]MCF8334117.1 histidine kinase [Bacteroidales bacterium]